LLSAVGGLILVGIAAGYFTRLVITNQRVMIVQGYEIRKTWRLGDLPRSLVGVKRSDGGELKRTVGMETVTTVVGGGSRQFRGGQDDLGAGQGDRPDQARGSAVVTSHRTDEQQREKASPE